MYILISATPSPYARKVRIALQEKGIPFTLQTEVPWDSTTQTPQYNPLEKLPVLIPVCSNSPDDAVYESHFILEWLEVKHPSPSLLPSSVDDKLFAKKVEVVCDGVCDALVLALFENQREPEKQSAPWEARQMRKVAGGLKALSTWVSNRKGQFLIGDSLTLADLAAGSVLGYLAVRWPDYDWQTTYPELKGYWQMLEKRESFANTVPSPQTMKDKIV